MWREAGGCKGTDGPPGVIGGRTLLEWERPPPPWNPRRFMPLLGMHDGGDELRPFAPGDFPVGANFALRRYRLAPQRFVHRHPLPLALRTR